jgi:chromosome segregation ATPase
MPEQSRMHFYLNWAKERIDEMDATLASLEARVSQVQADSKVKANQLIADLQKRRDEFQATVKKQAEAGEAAWQSTKPQLESHWNDFEAKVKTYIDSLGKQVQQQQATFRDVAAAQGEGLGVRRPTSCMTRRERSQPRGVLTSMLPLSR